MIARRFPRLVMALVIVFAGSAVAGNFSSRLSELTKTRVSRRPDGEPNHLTVRLTDDHLFYCQSLHMEDIGAAELSEEEVTRLREYLLKGGFLWVADEVHGRGISDHQGRLMVFMTHNTDISDAWEREGEDPRYFYEFGPNGYARGINAILYALSH